MDLFQYSAASSGVFSMTVDRRHVFCLLRLVVVLQLHHVPRELRVCPYLHIYALDASFRRFLTIEISIGNHSSSSIRLMFASPRNDPHDQVEELEKKSGITRAYNLIDLLQMIAGRPKHYRSRMSGLATVGSPLPFKGRTLPPSTSFRLRCQW